MESIEEIKNMRICMDGNGEKSIDFCMPFTDISGIKYRMFGINDACPNYFAGVQYAKEKLALFECATVDEGLYMVGGFLVTDAQLYILLFNLDKMQTKGSDFGL